MARISTELRLYMIDNLEILKNSKNKNNLNEFLARKVIEMHQNPKHLVVKYKNSVLCSSAVKAVDLHDEVSITSCQSEEADQ